MTAYMDAREFRDAGFLQEANRLFFHPLGLALEVVVDDDGTERFSGVWDYRDDPEGVIFAEGMIDPDKAARVRDEVKRHVVARVRRFGDMVQPVDADEPSLPSCVLPLVTKSLREDLLWMYEEHSCCASPDVVEALRSSLEGGRPPAETWTDDE